MFACLPWRVLATTRSTAHSYAPARIHTLTHGWACLSALYSLLSALCPPRYCSFPCYATVRRPLSLFRGDCSRCKLTNRRRTVWWPWRCERDSMLTVSVSGLEPLRRSDPRFRLTAIRLSSRPTHELPFTMIGQPPEIYFTHVFSTHPTLDPSGMRHELAHPASNYIEKIYWGSRYAVSKRDRFIDCILEPACPTGLRRYVLGRQLSSRHRCIQSPRRRPFI